MSDEIANWLEELGLGQYADVFAENAIEFRALPALTEDDLKELGLKLGHRRVLQRALAINEKVLGPEHPDGADAVPSAMVLHRDVV